MKQQVFELINSGKWGTVPPLPKTGYIVLLPGLFEKSETKQISMLIKDAEKKKLHISVRNKVGIVKYFEKYGDAAVFSHRNNKLQINKLR